MATKNCPHCSKQVPVACKKCGCGHTFFTGRKSSSSSTGAGSANSVAATSATNAWKSDEEELAPFRRRTGREREKPQFYDALEYENEIRKQKQRLRQANKQAVRTEDEPPEQVEEEVQPKKRRGRPPGHSLAVKKPHTTPSGRIQITGPKKPPKIPEDGEKVQEAEELMAGISPEKALQYNIILAEINRKLATASWNST